MPTGGQAAAYYYARKRHRDSHRIAVAVAPRSVSIGAQTLSQDTQVAQVDTLVADRGVTTLSLVGVDVASFKLTGRVIQLKSGVVLTSGQTLYVSAKASNTVLGDVQTQLEVKVP